jgi:hypothetical protein
MKYIEKEKKVNKIMISIGIAILFEIALWYADKEYNVISKKVSFLRGILIYFSNE